CCNNASKTYSLVRLDRIWKAWVAYSFSYAGSRGTGGRMAICGPLVRPFLDADTFGEEEDQRKPVHIVPTNPLLLGPLAGQVFVAVPRHDIRGPYCIGYPLFAPV